MKKILPALTLALMLSASFNAMAYHDGEKHKGYMGGGYIETQNAADVKISTVKDAMAMPEDAMVSLEGKIQKRVKKDKYIFEDSTGEIEVEIDRHIWQGQSVASTDTVMITGEVDHDDGKVTVDVERLLKK